MNKSKIISIVLAVALCFSCCVVGLASEGTPISFVSNLVNEIIESKPDEAALEETVALNFTMDITVPEAYKAGEEVVVTVAVNNVNASNGLQHVHGDLYFDTDVLGFSFDLKDKKELKNSFAGYEEWEDMTRLKTDGNGTWWVEVDAVTAGVEDENGGWLFSNVFEDGILVFNISFVALADASGDTLVYIPDESVYGDHYALEEPYTHTSYVGGGSQAVINEYEEEAASSEEIIEPEVSEETSEEIIEPEVSEETSEEIIEPEVSEETSEEIIIPEASDDDDSDDDDTDDDDSDDDDSDDDDTDDDDSDDDDSDDDDSDDDDSDDDDFDDDDFDDDDFDDDDFDDDDSDDDDSDDDEFDDDDFDDDDRHHGHHGKHDGKKPGCQRPEGEKPQCPNPDCTEEDCDCEVERPERPEGEKPECQRPEGEKPQCPNPDCTEEDCDCEAERPERPEGEKPECQFPEGEKPEHGKNFENKRGEFGKSNKGFGFGFDFGFDNDDIDD